MKRMRSLALLSTLLLLVAASRSPGQVPSCRPADSTEQRILAYVREFATLNVPARDSVRLNGLDTTLIVVEADAFVCSSVTRAVDSAFARPPSSQAYVVIRAGSQYVAYWPGTDTNGDISRLLHFLGATFDYRRAIVAF